MGKKHSLFRIFAVFIKEHFNLLEVIRRNIFYNF